MKGIFTFTLAVILVGSAAFATGTAESEQPSDGIPVSVMMGVASYQGPPGETYHMRLAEKKFGLDFSWITADRSIIGERAQIAFAANELPDLIFAAGAVADDAIRNGQFIMLDDYIENATYITSRAAWPDVVGGVTQPDGHIYALPSYSGWWRDRYHSMRYFINTKWLDNVGMEMPTTADEFFDVMIAFRDQDANGNGDPNDEIPISGTGGDEYHLDGFFMNAFGIKGEPWPAALGSRFTVENDVVTISDAHPNSRYYLEYMNRLWEADLIDPEYFTQQPGQLTAKGGDGRLGFFVFQDPAAIASGNGELIRQYSMPTPLTSDQNPTRWWWEYYPVAKDRGAITSAAEHPQLIFDFLDWLCSVESTRISARILTPDDIDMEVMDRILPGVDPANYTLSWIDDNTWSKTRFSEWVEEEYGDQFGSTFVWANTFLTPKAGNHPFWIDENEDTRFLQEYLDPSDPPQIKYIQQRDLVPQWSTLYPTASMFTFTDDEIETLQVMESDLEQYIVEMQAKFITGVRPFDEFDDYQDELEEYGLDEVTEVYQAAYDRYVAATD